MPFIKTEFPGLVVIDPAIFEDSRGYFFEAYNEKLFTANDLPMHFVQDNQSSSSYGVVRGLHYQAPPYAQTKLIRVLTGTIIDAVVDLRVGSPTYAKSYAIELSDSNKKQLLIPKGFAHGFSVISETAQVMYKCDAYYNRDSERGLLFSDPAIGIDWKIASHQAIVSDKDQVLPTFNQYRGEFKYVA